MYADKNGKLYFGDCVPGDRAATAEEIAAWEGARVAVSIKAEIELLERANQAPRFIREFMLLFLEANFTAPQLAANPGYVKVKAFDDQIKALRALL